MLDKLELDEAVHRSPGDYRTLGEYIIEDHLADHGRNPSDGQRRQAMIGALEDIQSRLRAQDRPGGR